MDAADSWPGHGVPVGPDRAALRAGDRDREAVTEVLREACGEGRLSVPELEERLELAYAARTLGQLDALVVDLLRDRPPRPSGLASLVPADATATIRSGFDNEKRTGRWRVSEHLVVRAHLGNVKLDFTECLVAARRIHIDIRTDAGNIVLVVPHGWRVDTDSVRRGLGRSRTGWRLPRTRMWRSSSPGSPR